MSRAHQAAWLGVPAPSGYADNVDRGAHGRTYRVIAEGEDDLACGLRIEEALAVAEFARERGKRHVAIVDEQSGALIDEKDARRRFIRKP